MALDATGIALGTLIFNAVDTNGNLVFQAPPAVDPTGLVPAAAMASANASIAAANATILAQNIALAKTIIDYFIANAVLIIPSTTVPGTGLVAPSMGGPVTGAGSTTATTGTLT